MPRRELRNGQQTAGWIDEAAIIAIGAAHELLADARTLRQVLAG